MYAADLNTLNTNILNNALALISPLTAALDCGGFRLTGIAAAATEASPSIQPTGDTNTGIRFSAADTMDLVTAGADRWQITSAGHLFATDDATYDIGASGATRPRHIYQSGNLTTGGTITVTGGQIAFPATQAASAGANTLDDYEEGTWTPGIAFGGAAVDVTYGTQAGAYTKIGDRVFFQGNFTLTSNGSSTGAARLTELPFTSGATYHSGVALGRLQNCSFAAQIFARLEAGGTVIDLTETTAAGTETTITEGDVSDTAMFYFSGNYKV